jgi:DNA-binding transcriptional MocR family regulator
MEQIRHWIAVADWLPGHELPSIRALAVKVGVSVIIAKRAADSARRERFRREARAPSRLSHPNVCAVCDIGTQNDADYIVMELPEGERWQRASNADGSRSAPRSTPRLRSRPH